LDTLHSASTLYADARLSVSHDSDDKTILCGTPPPPTVKVWSVSSGGTFECQSTLSALRGVRFFLDNPIVLRILFLSTLTRGDFFFFMSSNFLPLPGLLRVLTHRIANAGSARWHGAQMVQQ
jgi:hypothetical protein